MSWWDERVEEHQATLTVNELVDVVAGFESADDSGVLDGQERARAVVGALERLFRETDGFLVTAGMLDRIAAPLANAKGLLIAHRDSGDTANLQSAQNYLDAVLDSLAGWPVLARGKGADARAAASAYRKAAEGLAGSLGAEIEDLRATVASQRQELVDIAARGVAQTQASEQALAQLTATIDQQKTRLDTAIASFQEQFSQSEAQRVQAANQAAKEHDLEFQAAKQELQADAKKVIDYLKDSAEGSLTDLESQQERARRVVDTVGGIAFAGGYGSYADRQRRQADLWRWIAVGALAVVAVIVLVHVFSRSGEALTVEALGERLLLGLPLFLLAAYAATQSSRHRYRERLARKSELELAAIDPYLSLFPEVERNAIKAELAKRFFGQPDEPVPDDSVGAKQLLDAIDKAVRRQ